MRNYTTKDGEILDIICYEQYGTTHQTFESTLYAPENSDLIVPVFTAGVTLELPYVEPVKRKTETMLWE